MTRSDDLPKAIPAMWRLCKLGYQHEPWLLLAAFTMTLLAAVPDALLALWLKILADGVLHDDRRAALLAAGGLALSVTATWLLRTLSTRISRRFRDRVTIMLEAHVAHLQASVATVEHHERRDYLDRLSVLRKQVFVLDHMYMSLFSTCGWILRLAVTVALLMSIHPALALLLLFALPTVLSSSWRPGVEREVEERYAKHSRLAEHLFKTATTPAPGKEVRVIGIGPDLVAGRRREWEQWYAPMAAARWISAAWHALAWAVFGAAYVGAVLFVASGLHGSVGDVLLILAAGARLSSYIGATVGEIGFLRGIWLDGSRRLVWLENYAASFDKTADQPAPERLVDGIRLENVSFSYSGSDRPALEDVRLHLPAGKVVAVVGENGAGKSTLVKLICKLYEPDSGHVFLDDRPLDRIPAEAWRAKIAGAFQDFFRFEFRAAHSVGLGDLPRLDDVPAVTTAVGRAGAEDVLERLESGLDTQLGSTWPEGAEISFGQWQKLALARGFMRDRPLLLVLDEPTAALDAETEHALFERYAAAAKESAGHEASRSGLRSGGSEATGATREDREFQPHDPPRRRRGISTDGRITILVSHRFSTVRMADLIVVLDGAHVVETGTHEELIARNGHYADLYRIQAAAYH